MKTFFGAGFFILLVLVVLATVDVTKEKLAEKSREEQFRETVLASMTEEEIAEFQRQKKQLEQMIRDDPNRVIPYVDLAATEKAFGNLRHAEEILVRAAQIAPTNYLILGNLADIYRELGENEKADVAYARALHLAPQEQQNYLQYADFLRYRYPERHDQILDIYQQGLTVLDGDVDIYRALATYFEERGDVEKAIQAWNFVLEQEPQNTEVRRTRDQLEAQRK